MQIASGGVFGPDQPVSLNMLGSERSLEAMEGVAMVGSLQPLSSKSHGHPFCYSGTRMRLLLIRAKSEREISLLVPVQELEDSLYPLLREVSRYLMALAGVPSQGNTGIRAMNDLCAGQAWHRPLRGVQRC